MSHALRSISSGNLDPSLIDVAVFEQVSGHYSAEHLRIALHQGIQRVLPSLLNNLSMHEKDERQDKAVLIRERIENYRYYLKNLADGGEFIFVGKNIQVSIPAGLPVFDIPAEKNESLQHIETKNPDSPETEVHTAVPVSPQEHHVQHDTSVLPALMVVGHFLRPEKLVQRARVMWKRHRHHR